jgi:putative DNA primase/helicase
LGGGPAVLLQVAHPLVAAGVVQRGFPGDIESLKELVQRHDARLLVVDPLSAHLGGRVDSWKDQSIREALAPLAALAEERQLALLVVAHLNKGMSGDPLQRLGGSIGLPAAARSVLLLGRDPDDPHGEQGSERVLAHVKSNFGKHATSLALQIKDVRDPHQFPPLETARIVEMGKSPYKGSDLRGPTGVSELPPVTAEAVEFLKETLAAGPRKARDVQAEADEAGIPWDTVKRAKKLAGVEVRKERGVPNGRWVWELAANQTVEQPAA